MTRVILGSASPGRRKVLRQAGIEPMVVVSGIDEGTVVSSLDADATPADVTAALATAKAERVAQVINPAIATDAVVMAYDSMLYCRGELRGKPESAEAARRQWELMAGNPGQLHTGHCLIRLQEQTITYRIAETAVTTVRFGTPSPHELDAYIASGEPLHVAGGFTLDGLGGWFIDAVEGDPSNVIGLSLPLTRRLLDRAGLSLADLWSVNPA
jgi:septum formation protein